MSGLIGQHLGQYEITSLIGKGGMATVYRARQTSIERDVAIKVIKHDLSETHDFVARFQREARTVASLSHPHILKVFDYGQRRQIGAPVGRTDRPAQKHAVRAYRRSAGSGI
jgi:serine/threonine protein kinase